TQGKLVLGFRSDISTCHALEFPAKVMADILGGGTYSYLFENVREKMSLCYYCSAHNILQKGIMIIDCGIEPQNYEKAKKAIIKEFERIKNGDFTDEIIAASKLSFKNNVKRVFDTPELADNWSFNGIVGGKLYSVDEYIEKINSVTKQQIIKAAGSFKLDAEYLLTSEDN
ncbi:MAG: M16 family metallopeptidase, partial [Acutalibacteraceae bacterium]